MKKIVVLFIGVFLLCSISTYAYVDPANRKSKNSNSSITLKASTCTPATGRKYLEFNNVKTLIETGGIMWRNRSTGDADYEVPKGSGEFVIYAGSLWLGGTDANNQLKLAAMRYSGNDFWTGPLSYDENQPFDVSQGQLGYGPANITPQVCQEYDEFYITTRAEIETFNGWYECTLDPECDATLEYPGYQTPSSIVEWPGNFNELLDNTNTYDPNLAPFFDRNGDLVYDPLDGDYPWYDLTGEIDCRTSRRVTLYGDYNMWWVFNDKGNIHTNTGGDAIGMEIKAQAFAFATNDEINSMTFYNYELINRSTQLLTNTYFAVWADADIGCYADDFTGCDVQRGLGYQYNGVGIDGGCQQAIGQNPPAIGIDFFEGPYQDNDGRDNILDTDVGAAYQDGGIPYKGLGIGYGDGIADNERYGMKRFTYFDYTLNNVAMSDPQTAPEYYGFMEGFWRDNTPFYYGGTGHQQSSPAPLIRTNYCFPGDSDPFNWGTVSAGSGVTPPPFTNWAEQSPTGPGSSGNTPGDRRFVQSAGPFTLEPGALNNITIGVVYAKAISSDPFQSVELVRKADDKAQALFDNCFRILNGPDSPEMSIQELDKELILYLNKTETIEAYEEVDPVILSYGYPPEEAKYEFQGYLIYQLKDGSVDASQLTDPSLARLIAQCDVRDDVSRIINFNFDKDLLASVPELMVDGENEGIRHSFKVTTDAFAQGDVRLVNHKKYYFMVLSYGHNNFKTYDPADPSALDGQQLPFKGGRKSVSGGAISAYVGIPHIPSSEAGGTIVLAEYGTKPQITRVEGMGNGLNIVDITPESEQEILEKSHVRELTYALNGAPIEVKVVDPLNVQPGDYELYFNHVSTPNYVNQGNKKHYLDTCNWMLTRTYNGNTDTIVSNQSIRVGNEEIIPEWGISVNIEFYKYVGEDDNTIPYDRPDFLEATIEFADSSKQWLSGIPDGEGESPNNWIRSGTSRNATQQPYDDIVAAVDDNEIFEGILNGTWAPMRVVGTNEEQNPTMMDECPGTALGNKLKSARDNAWLERTPSVDVVITADKSKWTRCPVVEMTDELALSWDGNTDKSFWKLKPSIDKNGKVDGDDGYNPAEGELTSAIGMGWFPGYAIDLTTGERLNMAYGEDSWLGNHGGNDMIWNPSASVQLGFGGFGSGTYIGAGKHFVYIFRNSEDEVDGKYRSNVQKISSYDAGESFMDNGSLVNPNNVAKIKDVWKSCVWVGNPVLNGELNTSWYSASPSDPSSFILSDVRIRLRVAFRYEGLNTQDANGDNQVDDPAAKYTANASSGSNNNNPFYKFSMDDIAVVTQNDSAALDACSLINVVPNPYYAYSNYEFDKLDNVVKIVNLPDVCNVNIYTVNGTLVRSYKKDSPSTSIDWDLKNYKRIPVASGVYLIHVEVPGICERVVKWFGVVRPPDLDEF